MSTLNRDQLSAFLDGRLSNDDAESFLKQIEADPNLQAALRELGDRGEDKNLVQRLREIFPISEIIDEPFLEAALARATAVNGIGDTVIQTGASESSVALPNVESQQSIVTAAVEPAAIPQQLREYVLLEKLGEGGMGAVYKALHTRLDKIVALKLLSDRRLKNAEIVERFSREMKAVGKLNHPNIVRATDAGELNGIHYLVMEYVQGTDLSALVNKWGPLPVAEACELIRQAAIGLQHANQQGLVHRDLKPANLMLTVESEVADSALPNPEMLPAPIMDDQGTETRRKAVVKILDFGLARLRTEDDATELTSEDQVMGTLDYMAPEQATDTHNVDIRADIYSLGCTLYKLLTGRAPFGTPEFPNPSAKMIAHATRKCESATTLRNDLPSSLVAILDRALAKSKADRFPAPNKLAEALAPFCRDANLARLLSADEPGTGSSDAWPIKLSSSSPPPSRHRNWKIAAGFAAFSALLVLGITIYVKITDDQGKTAEAVVKVPANTRSTKLEIEVSTDQPKTGSSPPPTSNSPPITVKQSPAPKPQNDVPVAASLDNLDPKQIPAAEHYKGEPPGLVAVIGNRGRNVNGSPNGFAMSPDGKLVAASGGRCFEVIVWDVATQKVKWYIREPGQNAGSRSIRQIQFSPDGKRLLVSYLYVGQWAHLYDISGERPQLMKYSSGANSGQPIGLGGVWPWFDFIGQSHLLMYSTAEKKLTLFDVSGVEPRVVDERTKMEWTPGAGLASGASEFVYLTSDHQLLRLPIRDGKFGMPTRIDAPVSATGRMTSISSDGTMLGWLVDKDQYARGDARFQVWDISATPARMVAEIENPGVQEITFSADHSFLFGTGYPLGNFYRIDKDSMTRIARPWGISFADITPDHKTVVTVSGNSLVQFWEVQGSELRELSPLAERFVNQVNWYPAHLHPQFNSETCELSVMGDLLEGNKRDFPVWSLAGTQPVLKTKKAAPPEFKYAALVAPLSDGRWVVDTGGNSREHGFTKLGPDGWEPISNRFGSANYEVAAVAKNAKFVILADRQNNHFQGWDCSDPEPNNVWTIDIPAEQATTYVCWRSVQLSADGKSFVTIGRTPDGTKSSVVVWDNSGEQPTMRMTIPVAVASGEYLFAVSPDGKTLFHTQNTLSEIVAQDISGAKPRNLAALGDNFDAVHGLAAHPDGRHVVWWGNEGAGVFDLKTQRHVWQYRPSPYGIEWACFADDGRHLIVLNPNRTTHVIRIPELAMVRKLSTAADKND